MKVRSTGCTETCSSTKFPNVFLFLIVLASVTLHFRFLQAAGSRAFLAPPSPSLGLRGRTKGAGAGAGAGAGSREEAAALLRHADDIVPEQDGEEPGAEAGAEAGSDDDDSEEAVARLLAGRRLRLPSMVPGVERVRVYGNRMVLEVAGPLVSSSGRGRGPRGFLGLSAFFRRFKQ